MYVVHLISVISSFLPFTHFQFIPMSTFCLYLHVLSVWFYFLFLFDRATWTTVYMITSMLRWWQRPSRTNRMRWTTWHGPSCTEGWPRTLTTTTFKVTDFNNLLSNCNYNLQGNSYYILQGNHYYILQGNNYYNLKGNWNWKKIYITNKVLVTYAVYNKRNYGKSAVSLQTWSTLPSVSMVYITWHGSTLPHIDLQWSLWM